MHICKNCYCGSDLSFSLCCEKYINQQLLPFQPEQLMRSRYSAFILKEAQYLLDTDQSNQTKNPEDFDFSTIWLGLKIIATNDKNINDPQDWVEFVAFYQQPNETCSTYFHQLHEKSIFSKQNKQWFYTGGSFLPDIKIARNEACFCGSGKKYKKCHAV